MNATHFGEKTGGHGSLPSSSESFWTSLRSLRTPSRCHCSPAADLNLGLTVPPPCGSEMRRRGADFIHVDDVIGRADAVPDEVFA